MHVLSEDPPTLGYVIGYYGIFFAFLLIFFMFLLCMLCSCTACLKGGDDREKKNQYFKKRFDMIKYNSIYTSDRSNMISTVITANSKDSVDKMFGIDKVLASKLNDNREEKKKKPSCLARVFCCCCSSGSSETVQRSPSLPDLNRDEGFTSDEDRLKSVPEPSEHKEPESESRDPEHAIVDNMKRKMEIGNDNNDQEIQESKENNVSNQESSGSSDGLDNDDVVIHIQPKDKAFGAEPSAKPEHEPELVAETVNNRKIYLHYSFDNMNNDDDVSSATILSNINDYSHNVFRDLEAFVNIVLKTMDQEHVVILLRISSPGGYAYKFELAYTHLMRLRRNGFKLIALVDDICASGGYMLACACDQIMCAEYANIGSVGVVTSMYNYHGLASKLGVVEKTLTTGPYKRPFPEGEPYSDEDVQRVRESVDSTFVVFKDIVQKSRGFTDEQMDIVTSAKVWYGAKALEIGLVDKIVTANEYLDKLTRNKCQIYLLCRRKKKEKSTLMSLFELSVDMFPMIVSNVTKEAAKTIRHRGVNRGNVIRNDDYMYKMV